MGLTWTMGTTFGRRRSRTKAGIKLGYLEFAVQRVKVYGEDCLVPALKKIVNCLKKKILLQW